MFSSTWSFTSDELAKAPSLRMWQFFSFLPFNVFEANWGKFAMQKSPPPLPRGKFPEKKSKKLFLISLLKEKVARVRVPLFSARAVFKKSTEKENGGLFEATKPKAQKGLE